MTSILTKLNSEMETVVGDVGRSLVQVRNHRGGAGAGTIWHSDGLIVTNSHVVREGELEIVLPDGKALAAKVLARDTKKDIAALSVDAKDLPVINLGESKNVKPGQWVMAMGHPWGIIGAATAGVVIGLESEADESDNPGREWLAVNVQLRPGHSGGPIMDLDGKMLGINTMMHGPDVGMAVPVHVVKQFLKKELSIV